MSAKEGGWGMESRTGHWAGGQIQERASFRDIRYANCWEDSSLLCRALQPLKGARVLSVASAGDNTFSLLARGAETVLAADLSQAQLALVELKMAAFRGLDYEGLLAFLGISESSERASTYKRLRPGLSDGARAFWDARLATISRGPVHCGKFEKYFALFRRFVLPLIHPREMVRELLREKSREERERFYVEVWDNGRWRLLFRLFFSRTLMGRLGRDPEFFRYVDVPVSEQILKRTRRAFTELPTHDNPYLAYILNGNWTTLPDYLLPEHFEPIRGSLDGLRLFLGPAERAAAEEPRRSFNAFNLSDIFEYVDLPAYEEILRTLMAAAAPGARLAYWNMLAPRTRTEALAGRLEPLSQEAEDLHCQDRAFFYRAFVLEVVS